MKKLIENSSQLEEGDFVFFVYSYHHSPTIDYGIVVDKGYGETWVKWLLDPADRKELDSLTEIDQLCGELFLLKRNVPINF